MMMMMWQRIVLLGVLAGLAMMSGASAAGITVSAGPVQVPAGDAATVPVSVNGASDLGAMDLVVTYDPAVLLFSGASGGSLSSGGLVEANEVNRGTVRISFVDSQGINGSGEIVRLTFSVVGGSGSSTALGLDAQGYGLDLKDIPTSAQGGTVTVSTPQSNPGTAAALLAIGVVIVLAVRRRI